MSSNKDLDNFDKAIIGLVVGGLAIVGLSSFAAGYEMGHEAGEQTVKPPTYVYGDQNVDNSININSGDRQDAN